jgi:hypothetical protein
MPLQPDPMSEWFEAGARRLLEQAMGSGGGWAGTRLADPTPAQRRQIRGMYGVDPLGPDMVAGGRARTNWGRAFTRALYRVNRKEFYNRPGLQVEVGVKVPAGGGRPSGRAVRIRYRAGGAAARDAAVAKMGEGRRYTGGGKQASNQVRYWEAAG